MRLPRGTRAATICLLLLFLAPAAARADREPSAADSKIKLKPPSQDWLADARGLVRVWRCDWLVDGMAQTIPSTIVIKVTEHRIVEEGYEHLSVSWATPYRQDLTPNLSYYRITPESTVTVNGNSRGPRAVVFGSAGYSIEKTAVYEFFANPLEAFVGKNFSQAVLALPWSSHGEASLAAKYDDVEEAASESQPETSLLTRLSAESVMPNARTQRIRANLLCMSPTVPPADAEATISAGTRERASFWIPAALDVTSESSGGVHPEFAEVIRSSYRVVQWQHLRLSEDKASRAASSLPRLAVWEEVCVRPRQPNKSYHRMALMLIDTQFDGRQELTDWENILPEMRIAEVKTGKARVKQLTKEECAAWRFIERISADGARFRQLLEQDLSAGYSESFRPAFKMIAGESAAEDGIGAMLAPKQFQAIKPQPPQASDLSAGQGALFTFPDLMQPLKATLDEPATVPAILELVNGVRAASIQQRVEAATRTPKRAGPLAVSQQEQADAQGKLAILCISTGVLGSAVMLLFFRGRHKLPASMAGVGAVAAALLGSIRTTAAFGQISQGESTTAVALTWHVDQVRHLIQSHCETLQSILPESQPDDLWQLIATDHLVVRYGLEPAAPTLLRDDDPPSARPLLRALENYYGEMSLGTPAEKTLSEVSPDELLSACAYSTLESVLLRRQANCYSLAVLYYLHCRLAGVNMSLIAVPGHVMLCQTHDPADLGTDDRAPLEVYDVVRRKWLSAQEIARVQAGPYSILQDPQITAVLAFNLGTALSKKRDFDRGARLLEEALRLRFPFPDALKNLCLSYSSSNRHAEVIDEIERHLAFYQQGPQSCRSVESERPNLRVVSNVDDSADPRTYRDIQKLYFNALLKVGRAEEAADTIEQLLIAQSVDFRLYRLYLELKAGPEGLSDSSRFLPIAPETRTLIK